MKILVTGASGFVGTHLVPALIEKGHQVTALWNKNKPPFQGEHFCGDITEFEFVNRAVRNQEAVFHLAGEMRVKPSQSETVLKTAIEGTRNLIRACENQGVQKFLFTSSTVALGASTDGKTLVTENFQSTIPNWNHFVNVEAKQKAEKIILDSSLESTIVYSGLLYGAGDWNKSIRKSNRALLKGKMPFYFYGGVNLNEIENFIQGLISAFEKSGTKKKYILGGENITNQKLFSLIAESAGQKPPKYFFSSSLLRSIARLTQSMGLNSAVNPESVETLLAYHWCDSSKAEKELGYKPGLAQIAIQNSTDWIKTNGRI